jgi:hypothetical protein
MADLKPCPFCSGPAYVSRSRREPNAWIVGCRQYGAADPRMCAMAPASLPLISRAAAIAAWNVRPGSEIFQRLNSSGSQSSISSNSGGCTATA